jgi:site-specific DNA-cytosine methylase
VKLVLSLFSGVGALDEGFRRAGYCVVSAGDVAWSSFYDLRNFYPPRGVFDGVIGGDPCQSHSALANLVRAKGLEPSFPDLTPEFQRVIELARPRWFLRENVPGAPELKPVGYAVRSFPLDNWASFGQEQRRIRQFWFGRSSDCDGCDTTAAKCDTDPRPCCPDCRHPREVPELRAHIDFPLFLSEPKQTVTGRHEGAVGTPGKDYSTRYSLEEMLDLQGLPRDIFKHSPLTMQGKRKLIGNAVPLPMAEALARAVKEAA